MWPPVSFFVVELCCVVLIVSVMLHGRAEMRLFSRQISFVLVLLILLS